MSTVASYEIRRAGGPVGAKVTGIHLKTGGDDRTAEELSCTLRDRKVLALRDEHPSPAQDVEAVRAALDRRCAEPELACA
ncbi:hypothetical protein ACFY1U_33580 [Streptomyces sp. NPDC001351]|uniref:hypothetical protein n=1 Tax=Streptomyces sp. NPDC001351 TaxID=3364564 RepID=UPI003692690E